MTSILNSIKKFIGLDESYKIYDDDLIILINSEFSTLFQVGVGTETPFRINDETAEWEDFFESKDYIEQVKELIGLRVKIVFDPPSSSYILDAYKAKADELTWRLNVADDPILKESGTTDEDED